MRLIRLDFFSQGLGKFTVESCPRHGSDAFPVPLRHGFPSIRRGAPAATPPSGTLHSAAPVWQSCGALADENQESGLFKIGGPND
jgi:hypothetical protein